MGGMALVRFNGHATEANVWTVVFDNATGLQATNGSVSRTASQSLYLSVLLVGSIVLMATSIVTFVPNSFPPASIDSVAPDRIQWAARASGQGRGRGL